MTFHWNTPHPFVYTLWSCFCATVTEQQQQWLYGQQSLNYLISGPAQVKCVDPQHTAVSAKAWWSLFLSFKCDRDMTAVSITRTACVRAQSRPTLCNPMDCSPPGFSVLGVSQARIVEWGALAFSRRSSQPRDRTGILCVSCVGRQILYPWATWKP